MYPGPWPPATPGARPATTGSIPVSNAPHITGPIPVSGPPGGGPPRGQPSGAADPLDSIQAAASRGRDLLNRADAALSEVDSASEWQAGLRNALVYGAFAAAIAIVQLPLLVWLEVNNVTPALAVIPCGLRPVSLSFALGWWTVGFAFGRKGRGDAGAGVTGQATSSPAPAAVARTPVLGAAISLLAAAPLLVTALWALAGMITN